MRILFRSSLAAILPTLFCMTGTARAEKTGAKSKWDAADKRAHDILARMSFEEKVAFIEGAHKKIDGHFALKAFPQYGIPAIRLADATSGLRVGGAEQYNAYPAHDVPDLYKSTAFPANIALSATFNPEVVAEVAGSIAQACRGKGIHCMLAPSVDLYRLTIHGRNYEYNSEDPFLASTMVCSYVTAMQAQGVLATMKVYVANNTDFLRKNSNSQISERALREVWLRTFKRAIGQIDVGAVMTAYNLCNGEYCSDSKQLIEGILRDELGFKGLVMSDWGAPQDHKKFLTSGLDLIMPQFPQPVKKGLEDGTIDFKPFEKNIDRMVLDLLKTFVAMGFLDRPQEQPEKKNWAEQDAISLKSAREAIILLKNEGGLLPIQRDQVKKMIVTGPLALKTPEAGAGSGHVFGWDRVDIYDGLKSIYGAAKVEYIRAPTEAQLKAVSHVVLCAGFLADTEGENRDRPFHMLKEVDDLILQCAAANPNTVVTLTAGGALRMTDWNNKVRGIFHTLYLGQKCGQAIAEAIAGAINPSGKLPFTMEREYSDSYAANPYPKWATEPVDLTMSEPSAQCIAEYYRYLDGQITHEDWARIYHENERKGKGSEELKKLRASNPPYYTVNYVEDIYLGYKYYEKKNIPVMYPFGHGLSYTTFEFGDLKIEGDKQDNLVAVFTLKNTGKTAGAEAAQIYLHDDQCSVERPLKELCGFKKTYLNPGESQRVRIKIDPDTLRFWHPATRQWTFEPGQFTFMLGRSSKDIVSKQTIKMQ